MNDRTPPAAASDLPPSVAYDAAAARQRMAHIAATGLARFALLVAVVLLGLVALDRALPRPTLNPTWPGLATALLSVGALGAVLVRLGRPRGALVALLGGTVLVVAGQAWVSALGLFSAGIAGLGLMVMLAGLLAGTRAALAMTALLAAVVALLGHAESAGWIATRATAEATPLADRVLGVLTVMLASLVAALVLHRLVGRVMTDALAEQDRLAELLRIGSDWTWEMDARARLTYLSPSFEAGTGRTIAEFMAIGQPGGPQVVRDADWDALVEDLRACRPYRDRDIGLRCADGTLLVCRGNGAPVFGADGSLLGWRGVGRNATAERRAETERRRNDQLLDRLVRLAPDPLCVARLDDGRILMANPEFERYVAGQAAVGRSAVELGLWQDHGPAFALRDGLARGNGVLRDLRTLVHREGAQPRVMLITAAAFDWGGDPVAVISSRDVTDAERARLEADAILDNVGIGIALVREGRFERVNPGFEAMFGGAPGSLAGRPAHQAPGAGPVIAEWTESGGSADLEREVRLPDGRRITVRLRARPIDAARPREAGTIWLAEDITARREFERELALAKQQAEAANEAKSAFLATMSHEIRTPLNGVQGLAHLLQDPALDAPRRAEYLAHLADAASHLGAIVSDVLDLSKIEARQLRLDDRPFDLHQLAEGTHRSFAVLGHERGLATQCTIEPGTPRHVRGDPVRVRQIVANYLGNALKFTPQGRVDLVLSAGPAGRVRIEVRDTGIGVPPALRAQLFRPFVQGDGSTTRHVGGTGLGLSICRELALGMGGQVGVQDRAGGGSVFWVELPLAPAGVPPEPAPASDAGEAPLRGLRVLLVEDNPVNRLIVEAMLQRLGARVRQAEDGEAAAEEAAAAMADGGLDVVLMDLHMPRVDGLTATRRLLADPLTAGLAVYALSAAVLERDREAAAAAGMRGFIAKPVAEAELLRTLLPLRRNVPQA